MPGYTQTNEAATFCTNTIVQTNQKHTITDMTKNVTTNKDYVPRDISWM